MEQNVNWDNSATFCLLLKSVQQATSRLPAGYQPVNNNIWYVLTGCTESTSVTDRESYDSTHHTIPMVKNEATDLEQT